MEAPGMFGLGPMEILVLGGLCAGVVIAIGVVFLVLMMNKPKSNLPPSSLESSGPREVRCKKCQAPNDDRARYCDQCGTAL